MSRIFAHPLCSATPGTDLTRRTFVFGATALGLAGCETKLPSRLVAGSALNSYGSNVAIAYGAIDNEPFSVPAVEASSIDPAFIRQVVAYSTSEPPDTDPAAHYLYSVREGGMAMRYGIGVGRQGFGWSGGATIGNKRMWPDWYPPKEMLERQPEIVPKLTALQGGLGMPGGTNNPLGARAMYLYQGNKDTLYRIHGTFEPWTIGKSVSSGCIRMINQDAIYLYDRTPLDTRVVVLGARRAVG